MEIGHIHRADIHSWGKHFSCLFGKLYLYHSQKLVMGIKELPSSLFNLVQVNLSLQSSITEGFFGFERKGKSIPD